MMVEARPGPQRAAALAAELAQALDVEDHATARRLIAEDCVYETGSAAIQGADAIVASYAEVGAWARRTFEDVRYESQVELLGDRVAAVHFTDYLLAAGKGWHRYRCRQEFTFGDDGLAIRIVHHELPGERDALRAYLAVCGIEV